jgi:hypothetical protein
MRLRTFGAICLVIGSTSGVGAAPEPYSVKVVDKSAPPKELAEPIQALLSERALQILDTKGELALEFWLRKELPVKATEAQVKNGLTYREVAESTLIGAVRIAKPFTDYRKQKINPGIYTLRLGYQPMDGDHMGTAPHTEFCLLSPAAEDRSPDIMEPKPLHVMSAKTTNSHPGVLLLFPAKDVGEPKLVSKGEGNWALSFKQGVIADGKKAAIGFALTLVGVSPAA